ncbi:unnamed protein product [Brassicogethes aeneus]|uniref:E3 ubiquitin-protein ligase listerin n=1 Tax=Brassicogethes aeneus TaxID=1431903 RepID=A0A9P0FET8_BRAAE|nr:unnamed protein product [Brassicogethes aeneus]
MGGKHKVANRTKNNARPSSSGRTAELLSTNMPNFTGLSGIKETGFGLGGFSLSNTDELDAALDPNYQLVLKKINKKDSTTKLKGLLELAELIKSSDVDTIKSLLPVWPRYYNVLATDTDNRVREATHNAHYQIILKAKRNIAPFLKQLMAPWFTSQYDTYPPAATIATQAFKDTFPSNKFQEAVVFCQEEILSYIKENLTEQSAQSYISSKSMSPEEAEAKLERVLISSLQGYYLYLTKVSPEQIKTTLELNSSIVSNPKFWKLAKHKIGAIRAAWFEVLAAICQHAIFLIEEKGSNITNTVFSNLDETDPTVLPYVWECALLVMSSFKEWWTFINIDKLFLPKLTKILKQGAQGTANVIYPNLLPLLSHLPPNIDAGTFYSNFFENIRLGFNQKHVIASRSESVAVATALIECLQYVILKNQSDVLLCKNLIGQHIISTLEWCLTENQACYKIIFNLVASLAQYWSRNQNTKDFNNYAAYLDFFFENVFVLFRDTLFNVKGLQSLNVADVTSRQIEFLQCLRHISKPKKVTKVQFTDKIDSGKPTEETCDSTVQTPNLYVKKLNALVFNIAEEQVKYIEEHRSKDLLKNFYSLVLDFDTQNFFYNLSEKMKVKNKDFVLIDIFNKILHKWLTSNDLCSQHVVDLIFLLFKFVEKSEQELIMDTLSKSISKECLGWCISQALSHPTNKNPIVQKWLHNDNVSSFIVSIADKEIEDKCTPELGVLLKLSLTENENGDLFIKQEAVKKIIDKLINVLEHENNYIITFDTCSSLASYISAIVYTDNLLLMYGDKLLLALFKLACKHNCDPEIVSSETMYELNSAWEDAVSLLGSGLEKSEFLQLTSKFTDVVENYLFKSDLSQAVIKHLTTIVANYLKACQRNVPYINDVLNLFIERPFVPQQKDNITQLCKKAEYITGALCSPYEEVTCDVEINVLDVYKYFVWTYFKSSIIFKNVSKECIEEDSDCEIQPELDSDFILSLLEMPEKYVGDILYDLSLAILFLDHYKNLSWYSEIKDYYKLTLTQFKQTVEKLSPQIKQNLKLFLKQSTLENSWLWCKTIYLFYKEITPGPLGNIYTELVSEIPKGESLCRLQLTQIFGEHIDFDFIGNKHDSVEFIVVLKSLLHCNEIDVQIAEVFGKVEAIRSENVPQFLYESHNISWVKTQEILEIIRLCSGLISQKINLLNRRHWDFGVLSLVSWASNILKARSHYNKIQVQALFAAVANLFICTEKQIQKLTEESENNNYVSEWKDVLVESIHADLAQLWLYLAEQFESLEYTQQLKYMPLIQDYGKVVNYIKHEFLFKFSVSSLPKWTKFLKKSCALLVSRVPTLQIWGYKMLLKLVPGLIQIDFEAVNTNTPHKKGLIFEQFKEKLVETHMIVNNMLMGFKLGEDSCTVKTSTDSFTYTFAYLLLWDVLLTLCEQSPTELRYQYADWLRNEDLLKNFLNNLFRLMPTEVLHFSEGKSKTISDLFLEKTSLDITDECNSEKIEKFVCRLYASALAQLPALVRQWWTGIETRVSQVVEKVTSIYVSPHLCTLEFADVTSHDTKFKNMVIKVVPSVREVVAVYTVDEATMELVITLPANYPLGGPEVQCNRQIGGTTHKHWLLQFKKCVLHQNGRIWDGLSLWNTNLDKKFDGVEECYICFAVLHPGTYQLPKLSCQTCKKKFHSACLYKWFSTSNKSSCPICRNLF